jgi:hemerythrin-like domain-containing protein
VHRDDEMSTSISRAILGASLLALVTGCGAPAATGATATPTTGATIGRPTESFRREHVEIKEHLEHLKSEIGNLGATSPHEQRAIMTHVVGFVREHITPHAEWEERALYPAVDKRAASGPYPFTASMRYEHRIVARWTEELASLASAATPDVNAFARRADNLLGLIWAHFEEEEEVLLPILDRTMSQQDFAREIGGHETR